MAKWVTLAIGAVVIVLAWAVQRVPGNLYEVTSKTNGLFVAPLFGLFFMAMFMPSTTALGAVLGSLYGFVAGFLIAFWDLAGGPTLSFQWIIAVSLAADILVGSLASLAPVRGARLSRKVLLGVLMALPAFFVMYRFAMAFMAHRA